MADYVLYHHGIKGMKWGVRRYQNADGSLTAAGRKRQKSEGKNSVADGARKLYVKGLSLKRKSDKTKYIKGQIKDGLDPSGIPGAGHKKASAARQAYKMNDAKTTYRIAKQKAKSDSNYKNSAEYKAARTEYGKQKALTVLKTLGTIAVVDQAYTGGAGRRAVVKGAGRLKNNAMDKMFNASILDVTGKTIHRYNM